MQMFFSVLKQYSKCPELYYFCASISYFHKECETQINVVVLMQATYAYFTEEFDCCLFPYRRIKQKTCVGFTKTGLICQ